MAENEAPVVTVGDIFVRGEGLVQVVAISGEACTIRFRFSPGQPWAPYASYSTSEELSGLEKLTVD